MTHGLLEGTSIDTFLHIATMLTATALFAVSYRAYLKKHNKKFLYVLLAFAVFAVKEALITVSVIGSSPFPLTGLSHILNLVILGLFFMGTVR